MKKFASVLLAALLLLGASSLAETVTIGASPSPHAQILEYIKPLLAEKGFELEIVIFNDYVLPNTATESGELDANYFQHANYLFAFNQDNGTHLVPVIPVHFEPMGVFKGKTTSLDDLPDGAVIGVPNDTTNEARALQVLQAMGLIELDPDAGATATKLSITKNDKNLEIVEVEAAQLPRMLADFDLAVINGNYAIDAGLSLQDDTVGSEGSDTATYPEFVNYIVVKEGSEDAAFVAALQEVFNDPSTAEYIMDTYSNGSVVLALDVAIPTAE